MVGPTSVDSFARDNLPPREQWPDLLLEDLTTRNDSTASRELLDQSWIRRSWRASVPEFADRDAGPTPTCPSA